MVFLSAEGMLATTSTGRIPPLDSFRGTLLVSRETLSDDTESGSLYLGVEILLNCADVPT